MNLVQASKRAALSLAGATLGRTSFGRGAVFRYIHRSNHWGDRRSVSGPGSALAETAAVREALPGLLADLGVRVLVDAPCGDVGWLRAVDLDLDRYYGLDIVPALVARLQADRPVRNGEYAVADLTTDRLPGADAVLCRDSFIHFTYRDIQRAIDNFTRCGIRYLITNTYVGAVNRDIPTGRWRPLDLTAPPFHLPPPLRVIDERSSLTPGKRLGVWDLHQLARAPR